MAEDNRELQQLPHGNGNDIGLQPIAQEHHHQGYRIGDNPHPEGN